MDGHCYAMAQYTRYRCNGMNTTLDKVFTEWPFLGLQSVVT
jgi:hypothetical protein